MAQSPYAFLKIFVGIKVVDARPTAWDARKNPVSYVTTCSKCATLVKFSSSQILDKNGTKYVECRSCRSVPPDPKVSVKVSSIIDPIESGKLKIEGAKRLV